MSTKYGGYMGKVMLIDLTSGHISEYPWSDEERRLYIGGKTMAAKILGDHLKKDTEPFSEENLLVITTGPFTGTGAQVPADLMYPPFLRRQVSSPPPTAAGISAITSKKPDMMPL